MVNKNLSVIYLSVIFIFGIMGGVNALACSLETTCTSPNPGEATVMALSATANAHGEVRGGGGNYPQFVCCEFEGTDSCRVGNEVLRLSSLTNAHAETLDENNYEDDVCFGGLECISTTDEDCSATDGYNLEIVSIYQSTNAHLGEIGEYGTKICCKWENNAYWADAEDLSVVKSAAAVGTRVALVLNNSGLDTGTYDNIAIYENDGGLNPDDDVRPRAGSLIGGNVVLNYDGIAVFVSEWEITQEDYNTGKDLLLEGTPDEFYFIANSIQSPFLEIISIDESIAFCEEFADQITCEVCSNSVDCSAAYNSANQVSKDNFGVGCGEPLLGDSNYETNCFCQWDVDESKCEGGVSYLSSDSLTVAPHCKNDVQDEDETGEDCGGADCGICIDGAVAIHCKNDIKDEDETGIDCGGVDCGICTHKVSFPKVGSCTYISTGTDDCEDNFLEYSWIGQWEWGANNGFLSTNNDFSSNADDYINVNGTYYYDPMKMSENCVGGTNVISCPAQIKLPFFGFFGVVSSLILIGLIYCFFILKKD